MSVKCRDCKNLIMGGEGVGIQCEEDMMTLSPDIDKKVFCSEFKPNMPCPQCGHQLVEGIKEDEVTQWLDCERCGFDCIK